jgi:hypothetical protein
MVKFFNHWKYECGEVHVAHTDRFRMCPCLEDDRIVLSERAIDEHGEPIKDPEWWHSAQIAVREEIFKLLLGRESHMVVMNTSLRRWRSTCKLAGSTVITHCSSTFTITTLAISFSGVWSVEHVHDRDTL